MPVIYLVQSPYGQIKALDNFLMLEPCELGDYTDGELLEIFRWWQIVGDRLYEDAHAAYQTGPPMASKIHRGTIYIIYGETNNLYKIGATTRDLDKRLAELRKHYGPISLMGSIYVEQDLWTTEKKIHDLLSRHRIHGEWFAISPDQVAEIIKEFFDGQI